MNYLDFDLEILTATTEGYPMAVRGDAGDARATLCLPFDPRPDGRNLELQNRLLALRVALLSSGGKQRRALTSEEEQVQHFGRELFEALMVGDIRSRFDLLQERAQRQGAGVRIRLRIQPPEVATLPWEFLYDGRRGEYVCLSLNTPVVRYLETTQPIQPLLVTPPLRILGLVCSPRDLEPLNVALEKQRVERAVADLVRRGLVELIWLEGQSWRDLQRAMRRGPWHIFHFVGHGDFDAQREEGFVALADDEGLMYPLYANELSRLLADHRPLRLALLNACAGARSSSQDLFSSTAAALVRRGVAAVLAMQYPITDAAAIEFAQTFYESLAEAMPVDAATSEARKAISISIANSHEWGTPVLMMRSADGKLFEIGGAPVSKQDKESGPGALPTKPETDYAVMIAQLQAQLAEQQRKFDEQPSPTVAPTQPVLKAQANWQKIGIALVKIPAGEFLYGHEKQKMTLSEFWIAQTPITNQQYKVFVDATGYAIPQHWLGGKIPAGKENHPVTHVSWDDAQAFCQWAGVKLPTEQQWEKAARGIEGREYPWGNQAPDRTLCNFNANERGTTPVDRYRAGVSPYGVVDMVGNVWEWCEEWVDADQTDRVVRGGSFYNSYQVVRCDSKIGREPVSRDYSLGFRVVAPGS